MGVSSVVWSVYCLLGVIKDSLYSDWKLPCGNEIVYKLRRFVDFGVPLNYYFGLRTFPVSAAQIVANVEKNGRTQEDGMILQNQRNSADRRKSDIMLGLVLGDGKERQGQVYFTR